MSFLFRAVLYVVVLFLVTVVYHAKFHDNARATIRGSLAPFRKYLLWTAAVVAGMMILGMVFIG